MVEGVPSLFLFCFLAFSGGRLEEELSLEGESWQRLCRPYDWFLMKRRIRFLPAKREGQ